MARLPYSDEVGPGFRGQVRSRHAPEPRIMPPGTRPKTKYTVTPPDYIPSAHLSPAQRELCEKILDEHGVEEACKVQRDILDRRLTRPSTTHTSRSPLPGPAVILLAGAAGFLAAVLGGKL